MKGLVGPNEGGEVRTLLLETSQRAFSGRPYATSYFEKGQISSDLQEL